MEKYKDTYKDLLAEYTIVSETAIDKIADRILANKERYLAIEKELGTPWYFVAALHYRESNLDFTKHLHNGDPLTARTKRVPKGHPKLGTPPFTWEESAIDALRLKNLDERDNWDWDALAYEAERFNGFGYRPKGINSPYLWAGTDVYKGGKYVKDHVFDSSVHDQQMGVIPIMERILQKDKAQNPKKRHEIVNDSRKLTFMQRLRNAIAGITATIAGADFLGMLKQVKEFATDNAGLLLIGGAFSVWAVFKIIEAWSLEDYEEGRYTPSKTSDKRDL